MMRLLCSELISAIERNPIAVLEDPQSDFGNQE